MKPEPTQVEVDASRILGKIFQFHPTATDYEIAVGILASELAAVREEAFAQGRATIKQPCEVCWTNSWVPVPDDDPEAQKLVNVKGSVRCDHCWLKKRYEEAHNAGAAEMVERCAEICFASSVQDNVKMHKTKENDPDHEFYKIREFKAEELSEEIRALSPDPNWLQEKIEASTKELREALKWALDEIADQDYLEDDKTPPHDCGYKNRSDEGYCKFHEKYWGARQALKETEGDKNEL